MATVVAQDKFTLQCDLCKNPHDVKWKCLECKEWLCFNCKTAHTNSRATKDHHVSSLMDADLADQLQIQSKLCKTHKTESLCMYCNNCKQPICLRCITGHHESHTFEHLSDIINRKMEDLKKYFENLKKYEMQDLEKTGREIQCVQDRYEGEIQTCMDNIRQQGRQLKDAVDTMVETSVKLLEQKAKEDRTHIKTIKEEHVKQKQNLRKIIENGEKEMESSSAIEIINMLDEMKTKTKQLLATKTQPIHAQAPAFVHRPPDTNTSEMLKELFGHFDFEMEDEKGSECVAMARIPDKTPQVKIISKFQYGGFGARKIYCCDQQIAWLGYRTTLTKIKKDGNELKSIRSQNNVRGLARSNTGQLLISTDNYSIDTLNTTETGTETFCRTNSAYYGGICVAQDGDIYQCQYTRVVKMSPDGKEKQIIDFKYGKCAVVRTVRCITQNVNGDLWITGGAGANCVVLSKDGEYKFCYNGPKDIQLENPSAFCDLTHNKDGDVLICDCNNNNVHMVDRDGNFIQFLLIEDHGINAPYFISHDEQRGVWVGCDDGTVLVAEY